MLGNDLLELSLFKNSFYVLIHKLLNLPPFEGELVWQPSFFIEDVLVQIGPFVLSKAENPSDQSSNLLRRPGLHLACLQSLIVLFYEGL